MAVNCKNPILKYVRKRRKEKDLRCIHSVEWLGKIVNYRELISKDCRLHNSLTAISIIRYNDDYRNIIYPPTIVIIV